MLRVNASLSPEAAWFGTDRQIKQKCVNQQEDPCRVILYGGVEGPPHIFFDIMLSNTDDIVTRP